MADTVQNPVRQRNVLSVLGLIIIAVLFVAVVVLSNQLFRSARLDRPKTGSIRYPKARNRC